MSAPEKPRQHIAIHAGWYSIAFALTQLIGVVGAFVSRKYLGPRQTGIWALSQVFLSYAEYLALGANYAVATQLPQRIGRGEAQSAQQLKNVFFTFLVVGSGLAGLLLLAVTTVRWQALPRDVACGMLAASGFILLQQINAALVTLFRAEKRFYFAGEQMIVSSIVNLALIVVLSSRFRLYGYLAAMGLSLVFNILYIRFRENPRVHWAWNAKELKGLVGSGLPLMAFFLLQTVVMTADRLVLSRAGELEALGHYSIAVMTQGFVYGIPNAVAVVLLPNISEKYGETGDFASLVGYLKKSGEFFSGFMPLLMAGAWFVIPLLVHFVIPAFEAGIWPMRLLILGTFFMAAAQPYATASVVSKQWARMIGWTVAAGLFALVLAEAARRVGGDIRAVAAAMSVSSLVYFSIFYAWVGRRVFGWSELGKGYVRILMRFALAALLLFGIERWVHHPNIFAEAFLRLGVFAVLFSPVLWRLNRTLGVSQILFNHLPRRPNETVASV